MFYIAETATHTHNTHTHTINQFIHPSIHPSINQSIYQSINQSIQQSTGPYIHQRLPQTNKPNSPNDVPFFYVPNYFFINQSINQYSNLLVLTYINVFPKQTNPIHQMMFRFFTCPTISLSIHWSNYERRSKIRCGNLYGSLENRSDQMKAGPERTRLYHREWN